MSSHEPRCDECHRKVLRVFPATRFRDRRALQSGGLEPRRICAGCLGPGIPDAKTPIAFARAQRSVFA